MGWDHKEVVQKHESQKDYSKGFGGKFGVQSDRKDKCAVGWEHKEEVQKHESQKDYSKGWELIEFLLEKNSQSSSFISVSAG